MLGMLCYALIFVCTYASFQDLLGNLHPAVRRQMEQVGTSDFVPRIDMQGLEPTSSLDREERTHIEGSKSTSNIQRGVRRAW